MDSWKSHRVLFAVLSLPATVWLLVFFLAPLALVWAISFSEIRGVAELELTWTLQNYARTLDPLYLWVLWQSVWVAAVTTLVCLVIGYPVAMAISFAPSRWKPLLLLLVILPFWTNLLVRTYALIAVLRTQGYINFTLEWLWQLGHGALDLIGLGSLIGERFEPFNLLYSNGAVIYGLVYVHLPFMVLPLYAAMERLDKSYLEASLDLGAGQWQTLFRVTVPLTMPGIVSGVLITFIPALGTFVTPALLGGTGAEMIGTVIERQFKGANDWPFGTAMSFLLMYITFAVLALRPLLSGRGPAREG